jgi:hypothetical protein
MAKTTITQRGEINTASNVGAGSEVFYNKLSSDLRFRTIKSITSFIGLAYSGSGEEIEIDFVPSEFFKIEANCLASDAIGKCIYCTGDPIGGKYQVTTVDPKDYAKMPAIGIIVSKASTTDCEIQWAWDTDIFAGLTIGKTAFVGLDGSITQDPSSIVADPSGIVFHQAIGAALASDSLLIAPSFNMTIKTG